MVVAVAIVEMKTLAIFSALVVVAIIMTLMVMVVITR